MHEHFPAAEDLGGGFTIRPFAPRQDSSMIYEWTRAERARFWGMGDFTRQQIEEVYSWIDTSTTHHAYIVSRSGHPLALVQTYDPLHDEVGDYYDARPGDLGFHLMLAPAPNAAGHSALPEVLLPMAAALGPAALERIQPRRLIAEPDVRNAKAIARLQQVGFQPLATAWLPGQRKNALITALDDPADTLLPLLNLMRPT